MAPVVRGVARGSLRARLLATGILGYLLAATMVVKALAMAIAICAMIVSASIAEVARETALVLNM